MPLSGFHPTIQEWFAQRLGEPTAPQREGWPLSRAGRHTLIAAPTGSGKTLAAFLWALDALIRQGPELPDETHVLYVSPLKALSNDVQKNLQAPLQELRNLNIFLPDVRVLVRTGDTPAKDRAAMARKPPHILVTTPESLYILLTSESGRRMLRTVRTVIIDEVHALTRDKRGAHLALSLERLEALVAAHHSEPPTPVGGEQRGRTACASHLALAGGILSSPTPAAGDEGGRQSLAPTIPRPSGRGSDGAFQRIGLSATQKPIEDVARFLVGVGRDCATIDIGHQRELDIAVEVPRSPLSAVCAHEVWGEIYERIAQLIQQHRTTLVFVNTRKLAERIAARLTDVLGEEQVTCHHGSLSRTRRLDAERRLKEGRLRALVATASLELGIDIGDVDLAIQVGAPRSIATFLQRVGRAGHSVHRVPKGRLFPLTLDELVEAAALLRAVRRGMLDRTPQPRAPLDILAQQTVAACVAHTWDEAELYQTFKRAWPYRDLTREDFDAVVRLHTQGRRGLLHHDGVGARLRARRRARITAVTCGGAIPDTADYQVLAQPEGTLVGTLNEDFAVESNVGDIFQLGNASWRVLKVEPGIVRVADAKGAPPSLPFWLGEAPGRTRELSSEIGEVRELPDLASVVRETGTGEAAAQQLADYLSEGRRVLGSVPTHGRVILERFFDESGGMQLIVHALFGARINRAWGLALRKRFCRGFGFELQAAANEEAILISLGPQHSFPLADVFNFLHPDTARDLLIQALIDQPMFEARWRWN
ncbi:MAG TPA: DEAD/DEAH box helicase, partial [Phycisphaerae bacterium]